MDAMTFQFESEGEDIAVEVSNQCENGAFRDMVFVDHDISYDLSFVAMGGNPSTACLLYHLWYDDDHAFDVNAVCFTNAEFMFQGKWWVRLNDVTARMVLSFCLPSGGRAPIIASGWDFTIDQRLAMLEPSFPSDVAQFLALYDRNRHDLRPEQRLALESRLTPDQKGHLAISYGHYNIHEDKEECLRILLESTDARKCHMIFENASLLSRKATRMILDSMTEEHYIASVLSSMSNLTTTDVMGYAERLQRHDLRRKVGLSARNLSPEQRRRLIEE